ncbi:ABC transporter ATP-binding protein [Furfurilactobacillus entadae]|uniref:ABC transporter ATP-binding protein n=1 Tax=Furfurilactobacillus entadae TaxID=2922307 RepID=UPI0035EDD6C9
MVQAVLKLNHVTKQFGKDHTAVTALKDASMSVEPGQFISIIGPSGSGKSTLLTIAAGLQLPTHGQVFLNDTDLSTQSEKQRLQYRFDHVGFILQGSNLIPYLTVAEQFKALDKLAHRPFQLSHMRDLLDQLGLKRLERVYPNELSGGERQRVAIAKALYHQPELILADEPTASLDTARSFDVVKRLIEQAHQRQTAIIMVTHDERLTAESDAVYKIQDGHLSLVQAADKTPS